ncbi:MAG: NAD-glutamate dehydrogenase, partial [Actinomycetota bacterium]
MSRTAAPGFPLDALFERITKGAKRDRAQALRTFAELYLRRLSPAEVAAAADSLPGQVRAFNPDPATDGYETPGSVLETNTLDRPFLFDSVAAAIDGLDLKVLHVVHPVIGTERDADGRISKVVRAREATTRESVMHFELDRRLDEAELRALESRVGSVLRDVRLAVRDFEPMRGRVERLIGLARDAGGPYPSEEVDEAVAFLQWLLDLNFVFLGYREEDLVDLPEGRALVVVPGSELGVFAREEGEPQDAERPTLLADLGAGLRAWLERGPLLLYRKTRRTSTVHRRARMDSIGIRRVGPDGRTIGEARFVGLFTSKAYMEPAGRTPVLARKLERVLEAEDLFEGSHDYKAAVAIFESFPKDELFAAPIEELRRQVSGLLAAEEQHRLRLFVRPDLFGRSVSVLVALPRDRFTAELRQRLEELLVRRFHGSSADYHLSMGGSPSAQLHFVVHVTEGEIPDVPFEELETEVAALAETWEDRLLARLEERHGLEEGLARHTRWTPGLPDSYRANTSIDMAVLDIDRLETMVAQGDAFAVALVAGDRDEALTRVRIYKSGERVHLSDVVPLLEALGLTVVDEWPTHFVGPVHRYLHDFGVLGADGRPIDVPAAGPRIEEALCAVWRGDCESDSLNRLVVTAGLDWRQVELLRAYRKYHHRVSAGFPVEYKNDAFAAHPGIAAKLVRLFEARFDPHPTDATAGSAAALRDDLLADLDAVPSLEQDRVLRNALGLLDATVRTNAFRADRNSLAFKFRSADVPEMPKPTPLYEIFVYTPDVEAIHLRGGKVARGGIRWSDRRQDYRTEVLGLMKAQTVKNAVIVPTGSKGGFVVKRPPADPLELRAEVLRCYVTFRRGMLDLTDDLEDGRVVHPRDVVVLDEDDPYLVVAADKGTATFSDTANEVAAEYGYWLGDAFASGGSAGYDHKALGITARGAWESVRRHFRELGTDVDQEPITVVGIGDMSGDVFGNGMLRSDQLGLVAAFDHRHVFLDPNPVPAVGVAERRRLFDLPGSSWDDYDRTKLSAGGGVWARSEKSIALTPEARLALGVEGESLTPDAVIRAILRAPVDLLWNGGIGTWVKATDETHAEVDDRTNDALRVDAAELRCRVVAEGGNLGFTQRARIEYARRGGRINADFIDNSAGVDTSDHEVNLKILLGLAVSRGALRPADRDRLLHEVEDDVVRHVLEDNYLQAQILSQEAESSASRMDALEDLMQALESEGLLDRRLESLPGTEAMLERRRDGRGMVRPELAVLLAWAKRSLTNHLVASTLPESEYLQRDLRSYFPAPVVERFGDLLAEHPLRRELVATIVANDVVNSQGLTFVTRLCTETGSTPAEVVRAYRIARDLVDAVGRWAAIDALVGRVADTLLDELMRGVDALVEDLSRWYLIHVPDRLGRAIEAARPPFARYLEVLRRPRGDEPPAVAGDPLREVGRQERREDL